ncbi:MAG: hypothetical protein IJ630_04540 [Treponema sp.]|nr:hypothetical protein [Treponema sp.]
MSMDYRLPNPNKKLTENLVRQFAERAVKGADENPLSEAENTLTVLRDNGDTYTVLVSVKDEKTGEITQREETISRQAFEAAVKNGYLKKQ